MANRVEVSFEERSRKVQITMLGGYITALTMAEPEEPACQIAGAMEELRQKPPTCPIDLGPPGLQPARAGSHLSAIAVSIANSRGLCAKGQAAAQHNRLRMLQDGMGVEMNSRNCVAAVLMLLSIMSMGPNSANAQMQIKGVDETTAEIVRQYFSKYMMAEICITRYGMLSPAALKSMGVYIKDKFNDVNQEAKDAIWSITKANVSGVAAQLSPYACSGMIQSLLQIFPRNILMPQGESKSPF